jgi:hypothetical protein
MKKAPLQKHLALIMQDGMHYYKKNVLKNGTVNYRGFQKRQ